MSIDAKAFLADLQMLEAGLVNAQAQAMRAAVDAAKADAKGTTLYNDRTGTLRGSTDGRAFGAKGFISATAPYAKFVTNGTRFMRARPFMQHARMVGEQTLDYGLEFFTDAAINRYNR